MAKRMRLRSCSKLSASRNKFSGEGPGARLGVVDGNGEPDFWPLPRAVKPTTGRLRCRNHMSDFRIQKQQESYMAQVLDQKHKKASGTRRARSRQCPREK